MAFKIIFITILILGNSAFAQSQEIDLKKLKSDLASSALSPEAADIVYLKLNKLVKEKTSSLSMRELLEMCLQYTKHDPSDAPYDLIYDLKKSDPKQFDQALKEFSKKDKARILEIIKMSEDETKNGNG
ncbi:MAG: hypothetical protein V4596_05830 [Bdellovibrionota bacterium]